MLDAFLTGHRGGTKHGAADEDEGSTKCECLQHITAATYAAIIHHRHATGVAGDFSEAPQAGNRAIQLPAAMVGHHDAIRPRIAAHARIFGGDDALHHQLALPALADQFQMLPRQTITRAKSAHQGARDDRWPASGIHIFKMRHAVLQHGLEEGIQHPARMRDAIPQQLRRWL